MAAERGTGFARREALERRYDVLPPWAWRRPPTAIERLEAKIGAMESLIRETDRALAENLARIERLNARHRCARAAFTRALARNQAVLAAVRRTMPPVTDR